ncbi:MAG: GAF domain-containing protein, partial [Proteobacteria bacterium]|nr:GAF domain-containing protein [Pseudomonadota bacterium]
MMDVILDRFALLEKVIRLSNSTVDIERRLASLLQLLRREMQVERVCLFDLDREAGILALRTLTDENGVPPDLRVPMADNLLGRAAMRQEPAMAGPEGIEALPEATRLFFTGFQTLAVFPIMDDMQLYGVLTFLHRDALSYDPGRIMLIEAMARVMAGTIRNSRLYAESKKRIAELSVLNDVGRSISLTIDLKEVLDTVVKITAKVLMARGSSLNVLDEKTGALRVSAVYGAVPPACLAAEIAPSGDQGPSDHAIACASRREPYVGPACKDPLCEAMGEYGGDRSMICIPLHFTGNYKGALCLYDKFSAPPGRSREFGREDLELLSTMGTMISSSVENALTFQTVNRLARHNETLVRNLSCLYEISGAMMTTFYLDELLAIITNALTLRQGLGFDRALVLLVDEDEESLMGAALREVPIEARETNDRSLADMLRDPAPEPEPSDRLAAFFDLRLPLKEAGGVLVRTAATKQIFNVSPNNGDHDVESSLPVDFGRLAFTTVPMVAKGKVVGVIAVDRDHSAQEITSEDVRNLSMMANQAALAIENSRLYEYIEHANTELTQTRERLLEAEKLA